MHIMFSNVKSTGDLSQREVLAGRRLVKQDTLYQFKQYNSKLLRYKS